MLKRNRINIYVLILSIFIISIFVRPSNLFSATINLDPQNAVYRVGDTFNIKVFVSSDTSLNAVSANISFPVDLLSLKSVYKSSSIINLWAQEPSFSNNQGLANFEGVILDGYTGSYGNLVTLVFKAKKEGEAFVRFKDASILANDGNGTELFSGSKEGRVTINKALPEVAEVKNEPEESPREVVIEVTKDAVLKINQIEDSNNLPDNSLLVTIIIFLLVIIILIIFYTIYYIRRFKQFLRKKVEKTEGLISRKFEKLEKDTNKEIVSSSQDKKNNSKDNLISLLKIDKEIKETEHLISEEIEDIEKEL